MKKIKNIVSSLIVIAVLHIPINQVNADQSLLSDESINGYWGESYNNGETYWSTYHFYSGSKVEILYYLAGMANAERLVGKYQLKDDNICIHDLMKVHSTLSKGVSGYCLRLINFDNKALHYKIDNQSGVLYKVSGTPVLVNELSGDKEKLIKCFLASSGKVEAIQGIMLSRMREVLLLMKKYNNEISDQTLSKIESELRLILEKDGQISERLIHSVAIIYNKYFTALEITRLNTFYQSSEGEKYAHLTRDLAEETSMAAQSWARSFRPVLEDVIHSVMQREGYSPKGG